MIGDLLMGLTTLDAAARPIPGAATVGRCRPTGRPGRSISAIICGPTARRSRLQDFVFAWQRLLDPKTAAPYAYNLWVLKNARAISEGKLPPSALGVRAAE